MGRGSSKAGGSNTGQPNKPKSLRDIQIDSLERSWGGSSKAITADKIKVGDTIDGIQYTFTDLKEAPDTNKSAWSGDYNGIKMKVSADNGFKVTSVKVGKDKTEITAQKLGGTPMTAKKKISNDSYLRVYGRGK